MHGAADNGKQGYRRNVEQIVQYVLTDKINQCVHDNQQAN